MLNRSKVALLALVGLVALGGVAVAHKGWRHGGPHGPMGFEQMTERYDANKDGKISQDEIDTNRGTWLADADSDKSGSLALSEFQTLWLKSHNEQMVRDFQRLDKDANSQITLDEYKAPFAKLVAEMDRDKNGTLSNDEMRPGKHGPRHEGPDAQ